jgi:rare lipoprotein A
MTRHALELIVGVVIVLAQFAALSGVKAAECGLASYYCCWHHGRTMANGRPFDQNAMTAAHKTLPLGTVLRVTNPRNGNAVKVTITDRGPYIKGRVLDLSRGAAARLGMVQQGVGRVCWTRLR